MRSIKKMIKSYNIKYVNKQHNNFYEMRIKTMLKR